MKRKQLQCKHIPEKPILEFLKEQEGWSTHGPSKHMPTVQDAMPKGTPVKLQRAKMATLHKRGLVSGCDCGCRGDWQITTIGRYFLNEMPSEMIPAEWDKIYEEALEDGAKNRAPECDPAFPATFDSDKCEHNWVDIPKYLVTSDVVRAKQCFRCMTTVYQPLKAINFISYTVKLEDPNNG